MDVVTVLRATRALVEKGWTQNAYARTIDGENAHWSETGAHAFCLSGAMSRALSDLGLGYELGTAGISAMLKVLGTPSLRAFNDAPGRTKEEVLAKLDEAIALEVATP